MRIASSKEIAGVLKLDGPARFAHFVKRVADAQEAWGLWDDGWALMSDDSGVPVFPLWPGPEYAKMFATGEWAAYKPKSISLDRLLEELLPSFQADGVLPGIFPTPQGRGVTVAPTAVTDALKAELLDKYGE